MSTNGNKEQGQRQRASRDRSERSPQTSRSAEEAPETSPPGGARQRRESTELAPVSAAQIRETNPGAFDRPQTNPRTRPLGRRDGVGVAFARQVRQTAASSEALIAFVDSHNEIWTYADQRLTPIATPLRRVCSVSASEAGVFVGLADGQISRMLAGGQGLEPLFCDDRGRPITALAAARCGTSVLAGAADGSLFSGRMDRQHHRWMSLHANRRIAAVTTTPDGGVFAVASADGWIRVAATDAPGTAIAKLMAGGVVADMAFCNRGHLLAVLLDDGHIPVFQVLDGRQLSVLSPDCPTPQSLYFSDGNILYGVSTSAGRIARWNLTTGLAAQYE